MAHAAIIGALLTANGQNSKDIIILTMRVFVQQTGWIKLKFVLDFACAERMKGVKFPTEC